MKKTRSIVGIIAVVIAVVIVCGGIGYGIGSVIGGTGRVSDGVHSITVCETTDIHGAYFSLSYDSGPVETSMSNVSTYIKTLRADGVDPVLIDNGDNLQGDNAAYYFNYVAADRPHVYTSIAEYLGYDAIVMGNHDIETGHEVYDRLRKATKIPYLAANAVQSGGKDGGEPYFEPYTVVERDGVRVAVIGMTNANIKNWLSEDLWYGIDFLRISSIAQSVVDRVIEKEKPHIVILSVHCGTGRPEGELENEAMYLASTLRGVDAVLCGHDHRKAVVEVRGVDGIVPLVNAGTKAESVGKVVFDLTFRNGRPVSREVRASLEDMHNYPADARFDQAFKECYDAVNVFANKEIGWLNGDIDFSEAIDGPSACINLVQTVQLEKTGADISFTAPLSNRGKVAGGPVTFQNLVDIYRYENQLFVVRMTGRQIKDYLEFSYDNWIAGKGPAYNYDSADGIIYEVSRSAAKGSRVRIVSMRDGSVFDEDASYTVAMTSYRASGGGDLLRDGAGVNPEELEIVEKYGDIRSLIGEYISAHGQVTPVRADNWCFVN